MELEIKDPFKQGIVNFGIKMAVLINDKPVTPNTLRQCSVARKLLTEFYQVLVSNGVIPDLEQLAKEDKVKWWAIIKPYTTDMDPAEVRELSKIIYTIKLLRNEQP